MKMESSATRANAKVTVKVKLSNMTGINGSGTSEDLDCTITIFKGKTVSEKDLDSERGRVYNGILSKVFTFSDEQIGGATHFCIAATDGNRQETQQVIAIPSK